MVWLFQRFGRLTATEHVPAAGSLRFRLLASNIQVVNSEVVAVSCRNEDFENGDLKEREAVCMKTGLKGLVLTSEEGK